MQFQRYHKEGRTRYLVLSLESPECSGYQGNILRYHEIPYFLPYELREVDGRRELYYSLRYATPLSSVINQLQYRREFVENMISSIVGVLEAAEEYLLAEERIVWSSEYVFVEPSTGRLAFCYNPEEEMTPLRLEDFVAELMQYVGKRDCEAAKLFLQFYRAVTSSGEDLGRLSSFRTECASGQPISDWREASSGQPLSTRREASSGQSRSAWGEASSGQSVGLSDKCEQDSEGGMSDSYMLHYLQNHFSAGGERKVARGGRDKKKQEQKAFRGRRDMEERKPSAVLDIVLFVAGIVCVLLTVGLFMNLLPRVFFYVLFGILLLIFLGGIFSMLGEKEEESPSEDFASVKDGLPKTSASAEDEPSENSAYGEETVVLSVCKDSTDGLVSETFAQQLYLLPILRERFDALPVTQENTVLGSLEDGCDYVLRSKGISRIHAKLHYISGQLFVTDLNSTNGTFINGTQIESGKEEALEVGDAVSFANVEFCVVLQ